MRRILVLLWLLLGTPQAWSENRWEVDLDSTALGSIDLSWEGRWSASPDWNWGLGVGIRVPGFLWARGGGFDTGAGELRALVEGGTPGGWFVRGRIASGVSTQTQVLGTLTSWTGALGLEPGYRGSWGEVWGMVRPEAALITLYQRSEYATQTFGDRYEQSSIDNQPTSVLLGGTSIRVLIGFGTEILLGSGFSGTLSLGVRPPLRSDWVGWMDGFTFGEVPFFLSLGCRGRLD